ncbi:MAG TPA: peptidase T [Vicinamibacterales bacterium]|jgi:tripeptide aminopeptidase|nr:peptidase T [Vicinamibacterales bacterium]
MTSVLDRFLRYVRVDTQSDESSSAYPSTATQLVFLDSLARELRAMGAADVDLDTHGYVTATVPSTTQKAGVPTIGFIAHVDTSPEMPGANVKPIVHERYDGHDLVLPDDPSVVLRAADIPALADRLGDDIVTASGTTLLGADNKAGVAEIMTAVEYLLAHPQIPHGIIRVAFTPDEEIGRGTLHFDVTTFGARYAYTMDGGARGDVEYESFSADAMTITFIGFNTHPGYAKGRMVNAIKAAATFIERLPKDTLSPESTDGYEGFVHPYTMQAAVDRTAVRFIVRDFDTAALKRKEDLLASRAHEAADAWPGIRVELKVDEQYRNMREVLDRHPTVVECAREAMRRAGIPIRERPIRGGTDGSKLSFMGLPTPNLFAGEHNFHSRLEWVSVQDMEAAVRVIVELARVWEERNAV